MFLPLIVIPLEKVEASPSLSVIFPVKLITVPLLADEIASFNELKTEPAFIVS